MFCRLRQHNILISSDVRIKTEYVQNTQIKASMWLEKYQNSFFLPCLIFFLNSFFLPQISCTYLSYFCRNIETFTVTAHITAIEQISNWTKTSAQRAKASLNASPGRHYLHNSTNALRLRLFNCHLASCAALWIKAASPDSHLHLRGRMTTKRFLSKKNKRMEKKRRLEIDQN